MKHLLQNLHFTFPYDLCKHVTCTYINCQYHIVIIFNNKNKTSYKHIFNLQLWNETLMMTVKITVFMNIFNQLFMQINWLLVSDSANNSIRLGTMMLLLSKRIIADAKRINCMESYCI